MGLTCVVAFAAGANQLKDHPSPYLAMHGADPVDWRVWGKEAIEAARREGKPLFVSSGYFACHWCHVMHRESYHDPELARFLNRHFIPIKLDRELHPALDAHLIDFVQRTRGSAGWPLNVFLTPEGYPLIGVTYLPKDQFMSLLVRLAERWGQDRVELEALARKAAKASMPTVPSTEVDQVAQDLIGLVDGLLDQSLAIGDDLEGGFGRQRRFPMAPQLLGLLEVLERQPSERLRRLLRLTLDQIASQGLRDHLGGGFFRYTVDPGWQVPHFEKMLYTSALLAEVYLVAARVLDRPEYRPVVAETLDFLLAGMSGADGAFIASLSAVDADGVEGGYYLWRDDQLEQILTSQQLRAARLRWGFDGAARLEHGHHAVDSMPVAEVAVRLDIDRADAEQLLGAARAKLLEVRAGRSLPRDDKRLAAWNGLVLSALARAARELDDSRYRAAARRLRDYLVTQLWDGQNLLRARHGEVELGAAALEDYAYVARGLADWAALAGSRADRELAMTIARAGWRRFYAEDGWRASSEMLIPALGREPALADGPMPSPSAVLIDVTLRLTNENPQQRLTRQAREALARSGEWVKQQPFRHVSHVVALLRHYNSP